MSISPKTTRLCIVLLAVLAPTLAVSAAPSLQTVITARQAGYKKMGASMKALREQLSSAIPAAPIMIDAAHTIAATAKEQAKLFPKGSGPDQGIATAALPNIWTDRAAFDVLMANLATESAKLEIVVKGGDVAAIGDQLKATGATCGACHRQFRSES